MPAADIHTPDTSELERIEQWRAAELERGGFSPSHAATLASRHDVDLHFAIDLLGLGCPPDVAFEILV